MASGRLNKAVNDFITDLQVGNKVTDLFVGGIETGESEASELIKSIKRDLNIKGELPLIDNLTNRVGSNQQQPVLLAILIPLLMFLAQTIAQGIGQPISEAIRQLVADLIRPNISEPDDLVMLLRWDLITEGGFYDVMGKWGYNENVAKEYLDSKRSPINLETLLTLINRGEVNKDFASIELSAIGYKESTHEALLSLRNIIPGVNDLISIAVREGFNDETAQRFGYDKDFPTDILEFTEKQGLSSEWVKRYWRAHWQLPGIQQAFEMFQRLGNPWNQIQFTREDLDTYLVAADIPSFYRDRLTEISYRLPTRVDIRRFVELGIWDDTQAYQAFIEQGQTPEVAEALLQFAHRERTTQQRELTRTAIQDGYEIGRFTRNEALELLQGIGYAESDSDFWLDLTDYDKDQKELREELDRAEFLFVEGEIDENGVYDLVGRFNLPADETTRLIQLWSIRREKKIQLPSKADLEGWYKDGIIDENKFREGMKKRGYLDDNIQNYIQEIDKSNQERAEKEAERATKEQERVQESDLSDKYREDSSEIEKQIADDNLAIANIKVAIHDLDDSNEIRRQKIRIDEIKAHIADLRLQKANIRLNYEVER